MNLLAFLTRKQPETPEQRLQCAASELGRQGGLARHAREREPIRAMARQLCAEIGKPVPEALR